jgi:hypothetical protein
MPIRSDWSFRPEGLWTHFVLRRFEAYMDAWIIFQSGCT